MSFFSSTAALQWACWAALLAFGSALIIGLLSYRRISQYLGVLGVAASGLAVFLMCWQTQRPPLMGLYETIGEMAFLLGGAGPLGPFCRGPGIARSPLVLGTERPDAGIAAVLSRQPDP